MSVLGSSGLGTLKFFTVAPIVHWSRPVIWSQPMPAPLVLQTSTCPPRVGAAWLRLMYTSPAPAPVRSVNRGPLASKSVQVDPSLAVAVVTDMELRTSRRESGEPVPIPTLPPGRNVMRSAVTDDSRMVKVLSANLFSVHAEVPRSLKRSWETCAALTPESMFTVHCTSPLLRTWNRLAGAVPTPTLPGPSTNTPRVLRAKGVGVRDW